MSVRPVGSGLPNPLRINGQEIEARITPTTRVGVGDAATQRPVDQPHDPYRPQEEAYDQAHEISLRGENAAAKLLGRKRSRTRELGRRGARGEEAPEHKRVSGVFSESDPHHRQEHVYEVAAEFEEHVKEGDLTFARKAAQVEAGAKVYSASYDNDKGSVIAGESELFFEDTVPDIAMPEASNTALRRALGLEKE
jgi:hypothetical protein